MDSRRLDLDCIAWNCALPIARLMEPRAVARIAHSIGRCGQVVPCIVVAVADGAGGEPLVLIDGYRRCRRRCVSFGRDTQALSNGPAI